MSAARTTAFGLPPRPPIPWELTPRFCLRAQALQDVMDRSFSMDSVTQFTRRREELLVIGFFLVFLVLNLVTGSRSPTVWTDEVCYADPSINLVESGAFTSTAWEVQSSSEHWAGNVPLYQLLLAGWLHLFGTSITAVRSLNYVLVLFATGLLWLVGRRTGWISNPATRLVFVIMVLSGYGVSFAYRSGRPDMLGFFLVSVGVFACTLSEDRYRHWAVLMIGALLPISGLQFLPYIGLLCGLGLFWVPSWLGTLSIASGFGTIFGGGALAAYYRYRGVWDDFLQAITRHTAAGQDVSSKLLDLPSVLHLDPSYTLLLFGTLSLGGYFAWRRKTETSFLQSNVIYLLTVAVATPVALFIVGKYTTPYSWMGYVPLAFGVCVAASTISWNRSEVIVGLSLLVLVCGIGLPARVGISILQWEGRSYEPVKRSVSRHITDQDTVFSTYQGYYAAKAHASTVYLPKHTIYLSSNEKAETLRSVDKLILSPRQRDAWLSFWSNRFSGWEQVGRTTAEGGTDNTVLGVRLAQPYDVIVYKRPNSYSK